MSVKTVPEAVTLLATVIDMLIAFVPEDLLLNGTPESRSLLSELAEWRMSGGMLDV